VSIVMKKCSGFALFIVDRLFGNAASGLKNSAYFHRCILTKFLKNQKF